LGDNSPKAAYPLGTIVPLCALAFLVLCSYAVARPACEALFLEAYGSEGLPKVWIAVALVATLVVTIYNRYSASIALVRLFAISAGLSAAILAILIKIYQADFPPAAFALYVFKDVYVVVLVEIFWSFANATFAIRSAKWLYGLFCVMGSLGGIVGNLGVGYLAKELGTAESLWLVIPLLLVSWLLCVHLNRVETVQCKPIQEVRAGFRDGFSVLLQSRYLVLILALIAVIQVVITLVDYQFNVMVEQYTQVTAERTVLIGRVYAAIDVGSISLQMATGPILRYVGIPVTLMCIPLILGGAVGFMAAAPRFVATAAAKIVGKCLDYSVFRAAKEILYIPLNYAEKTQGKAIIDILAYRVAKGLASALVLALVALELKTWMSWLATALVLVWMALTVAIVNRFRRRAALDSAIPRPGQLQQAATKEPELPQ
jgi:AAA family ATP:ADP antiporter